MARRDFVFMGDPCRAVLRAIDGTGSGAYHFSSGKDVAIKELYDAVVEAMGLTEYRTRNSRIGTPMTLRPSFGIPPEPSRISDRWNLRLFWRLLGLAWNTSTQFGAASGYVKFEAQ